MYKKVIKFSVHPLTQCIDIYSETFHVQTSEYCRSTYRKTQAGNTISVCIYMCMYINTCVYTQVISVSYYWKIVIKSL